MKRRRSDIPIHLVLITIVGLTLLPFVFVINNSMRRTTEQYHSFFGLPEAASNLVRFTWFKISGQSERIELRIMPESPDGKQINVRAVDVPMTKLSYGDAVSNCWHELTKGYVYAWQVFRPFMINSLFVSLSTAFGVVVVASLSAYVFARYRFPGHRALFFVILSFMMIPWVLTLVPSWLWVKRLGLINSYWVLILPYITGGQIIAIFLFKGFFEGLPEELFESARLDGAGHLAQYWHIVVPLSKQIMAVVVIVNILGTWNNFLWPLIANTDQKLSVVSTGLYYLNQTQASAAGDRSTMFAAYVISSIPLLILFIYATKPFMSGVTAGAFKA
ncbi:MAG TPA: carbohydrate ABC transporter permease [Tepidisphaeraceae bacterium]|jgi:ABC-type glycerol-3-phosphate transport system permease component|nr:carbohydrate ABC transporter permease [Tepidisphaeraceae bacterium]